MEIRESAQDYLECIYNYIKKKFDIDSQDLYEYLHPDILIIYRGKKGSDRIYHEEFEKKEIIYQATGAEDAYFAEFIPFFINNPEINTRTISMAHIKASSIASYVITKVGARTNLMPLIKVTDSKECICINTPSGVLINSTLPFPFSVGKSIFATGYLSRSNIL